MIRNRIFTLGTIVITIIFMTSCGMTPHPNEKIIIGIWRPVKVEKVVDSSALQAAASMSDNSGRQQVKEGRQDGEGAVSRKDAALDRLIQNEMRATMEIFPNKTAVKNFPGKPLNATWKMKGKGSRIVAKNIENKMKFVIEILEISKEQIIVIEHVPVGDIKITYERQL
ncbi:MAG: hypothetical protein Q8M08_01370 [Bacteroidales bacterium]|nr:hypothetical protein [Bacteroidales bacterium]